MSDDKQEKTSSLSVWSQSRTCCCRHPDRYECFRIRYQADPYPYDEGESCECSCHQEGPDGKGGSRGVKSPWPTL